MYGSKLASRRLYVLMTRASRRIRRVISFYDSRTRYTHTHVCTKRVLFYDYNLVNGPVYASLVHCANFRFREINRRAARSNNRVIPADNGAARQNLHARWLLQLNNAPVARAIYAAKET